MVPKYPFIVRTSYRTGNKRYSDNRNYETLSGAMTFRDGRVRQVQARTGNITRVEVLVLLDDYSISGIGEIEGD